ncbi:MAG: sortase [Chloroflexota bacterium]
MQRLRPPRITIIERVVTGATVLIWLGVVLMAAGLIWAYMDFRTEQQAVAQAESLSFVLLETATPTVSPTATLFPSATPTPTTTPTTAPEPDIVATLIWSSEPGVAAGAPTADPTRRPSPTLTPTPSPTFTPTPEPTPTPGGAPPATAPPDRIVIAAISLDAKVLPIGWHIEEQDGQRVSVWDVPDFAAGWHRTSAYPGNGGNVVLNGHHNIRGEVFRYLIDLEPGALVRLYVGETVYTYSVTEKQILKEKGESPEVRYQNAQWIAPTQDERLTLVTCWPYTSNSHRLIVVARPYQAPNGYLESQ